MRSPWGETPFAALLLSLALGIVCSRFIHSYWFSLLALAGGCLIVAAIAAFRKDQPALALWSALAAISLCGMTLALTRRDVCAASDLRALVSGASFPLEEPLLFEGCVVEEVTKYANEAVTTIELHGYQRQNFWTACRGKGVIEMPADPETSDPMQAADLRRGDRVRGWAVWHVPRNYQNPGARDRVGALALQGIYLIGRVKSIRLMEVIPQDCSSPWSRQAAWARKKLLQNLSPPAYPRGDQTAAILASLLVGDYSRLSNETREAFQNNGTYHVLVVSGMHIGAIAWILLHLLRVLHCPVAVSRCLVAFGIFFYSSIVGFQASITRSFWMFLLLVAGQFLVRRAAPANLTFASAFLLLSVCPDWIRDIGFQLSFVSVSAICLTALPLIENFLKPLLLPLQHADDPRQIFVQRGRFHRWGRRLRTSSELIAEACSDHLRGAGQPICLGACRTAAWLGMALGSSLIVTISIQFWLEPLLAYHFNRLAWVAPLANLIMVPFSSLLLLTAAASAFAAGIPGMATLSLATAAGMARVFLNLAQWISEIPGAWQRCPTPELTWVLTGLSAIFAWSFFKWRRPWIPCLLIILILGMLSTGWRPTRKSHALDMTGRPARLPLSLTLLDVGEGDSIVLRFPDEETWVLDGGGASPASTSDDDARTFDVGEAVVSRYLWFCWDTTLAKLVLSHPDGDHAGGMLSLMKNFRIGRFEYGEKRVESLLARILETAQAKGVTVRLAQAGDQETHAGVRVSILNPPNDDLRRTSNENSLVLHLNFGRFTALLTGDLEKSGEADFVTRNPNLRAHLLKVAHHGSRSATSDRLLSRVQPVWGMVSVGRGNAFGHPAQEVLSRLTRHGVRSLLTPDHGAITLETDGDRYILSSYVRGILDQGILPR